MTALMERRGPDDSHFWSDPAGHLHLGFRRLAVMDPSPLGRQPMVAGDGRSVIVFNGEIYNFRELRAHLEHAGARFRSRTDTEVLLEALARWGPDAISKLNGMFAFAWYDLSRRTLLLGRDHAGIKPLYYSALPGRRGFAFASQYDALFQTPWGEPGPLNEKVLRLYLRLHHIPPPYGLFANTFQLEPGHYLVVHADGHVEKHRWWALPRSPRPDLSGTEAVEAVAAALENAVRRQRIADVPLGLFLSGGVDSPLVAAVTREQVDHDLVAYTIGTPGWGQDESTDAATYARLFRLRHELEPVTGEQAISALQQVIEAQHEPFADFSMLPTLLVSQRARRELTVALSGDGGDELFFGYERPRSLLRNGSDFRFPRVMRLALYAAGKYGLAARRSSVIVSKTPGHYYFDVNSRLKDDELARFMPGLAPLPDDFSLYDFDQYHDTLDLANYSRYVEYYGQLQRGLKKVDMASMHHSLEVRVPLLDREVVDVSLRVDPFVSMKNGTRKAILFQLLERHVPPHAIPRGKRGFAVPLGEWLRGPLRSVVEDTLFSGPLFPEGLWDRRALRHYWEDHLSGRRDVKWGLWTLLCLQWWYRYKKVVH